MSLDKEKELQIAEYFLKSFEEKTPFDYDILDSMINELKPGIHKIQKLTLNNLQKSNIPEELKLLNRF